LLVARKVACPFVSGWLSANAFNASGVGLPVTGSGFNASISSRNVRGMAGKNMGVLIIVMCRRLPLGSLNSSAMPRGLLFVSDACGSPSASEKRATTGTGCPENKADLEYAAASGLPTNVPSAQVSFVWLRRSPGCTP